MRVAQMLNVVRVGERLKLIDFDASATIAKMGAEPSFAGAKFSSAVLPPEMLHRLEGDSPRRQFEAHFAEEIATNTALWTKIAPKDGYVVKTFLTKDDANLPYELVEANSSLDLWSLGMMLFELLTGDMLVPSNRDQDFSSASAMKAIHEWDENSTAAKRRFAKIDDPSARDLVQNLLKREPADRPSARKSLEHPLFQANPKASFADLRTAVDAPLIAMPEPEERADRHAEVSSVTDDTRPLGDTDRAPLADDGSERP